MNNNFHSNSYLRKFLFICLFLSISFILIKYSFKQQTQFIFTTKSFSTSMCNFQNRQYIFKEFFNFICQQQEKSLNFSLLQSQTHICEQLYSNQSLYSQLIIDFQRFHKQKISLTDIQNLSISCSNCHHIQILDNKLYHIPNPSASDYETRSRSIKMFLKFITELFPNIRDMDLFFNVQDITDLTNKFNDILFNVPIFGLTKTRKFRRGLRYENIILMPCFTLWNWPEARVGRWPTKFQSLLNTSSTIPYEKRIEKLFWRGILNNWRRTWFKSLTNKSSNLIDIQENVWRKIDQNSIALTGTSAYTSLEDHCKYKYLVHIEGGSYSSRLKYLLSCGSTVIYDHGDHWEEYWYHLLEHKKNVILFEQTGNETALKETLEYLSQNQDKAKDIGKQGQNLISNYLNEHAISCYWWKLLDEYGKLIDYKPILHSKAIPIDDFILGR